MRKIHAFVLVLFCVISSERVVSAAQDIAKPSHTEAIPKRGYKTWSLFLICNPRWMADDKTQDLNQLHRAFQAFGNTIGHDNLAVWFWKHQYQAATTTIDDVDLERSSGFCAAYNLAPSKGPYVVVTSTYPDDSHRLGKLPPNNALLQLGAMKPGEISDLLASLADKLVANQSLNQADSGQPAPQTVVASWDVRLLAAAQQQARRSDSRIYCARTLELEFEASSSVRPARDSDSPDSAEQARSQGQRCTRSKTA